MRTHFPVGLGTRPGLPVKQGEPGSEGKAESGRRRPGGGGSPSRPHPPELSPLSVALGPPSNVLQGKESPHLSIHISLRGSGSPAPPQAQTSPHPISLEADSESRNPRETPSHTSPVRPGYQEGEKEMKARFHSLLDKSGREGGRAGGGERNGLHH